MLVSFQRDCLPIPYPKRLHFVDQVKVKIISKFYQRLVPWEFADINLALSTSLCALEANSIDILPSLKYFRAYDLSTTLPLLFCLFFYENG